MKLLSTIALAAMAFSAQLAHADAGPYYVSYPGYCNIKKVWLTPGGDVYGYETGCSSALGSPVVGSTTVDGRVAVSSIVNGYPCMSAYWTDGTLVGGCSTNGTSISYPPRSTFLVRTDLGANKRRNFNVSDTMPDTSATKDLPATEF